MPGVSSGRTRAFLKIQEGCDDVCAFCIVPAVRGRERARPIAAIVAQTRAAESAGTLEVVLTGTQPGAYGRDRDDGTTAAALLAALLSETDAAPHPLLVDSAPGCVGRLAGAVAGLAALSPFPPGATERQRCGPGPDAASIRCGGYLRALERIRAAVPGVAITADVIVGFSGETADDFRQTLRSAGRPNSPMCTCFRIRRGRGRAVRCCRDDVPPPLKRERLRAVEATVSASRERYRSGLAGSAAVVLIEGRRRGRWSGLTDTYVPVFVSLQDTREDLTNRLLPLRLGGQEAGARRGRMLG